MIPNVCLDFRMFRYIEIVQLFKNVVGNCIGQRQNHLLWLIDARLFELEKPTWAWTLDVGMDRFFFVAQTSSNAASNLFVCCKLFPVGFTKSPKIMMMKKMFLVLALLAHGVVSVRSGNWLSEGQLELDNEEKEIEIVVQKRVKEEIGISATCHQVKELLRLVCTEYPFVEGWGVKDWAKLPSIEFQSLAKFYLPLDVGASAVAFCGELVKATTLRESIKNELRGDPEEICSQVLTGNLSMSNAPEWAVKAAQVAEMDGQQHPYGRLDGVAWKHSLTRVCHDECEELVQGIRDNASELTKFAMDGKSTIEDACAAKVVRHVEAEILGCCSKSCGWNGQFCSFFPFLSSKEQTDWQAECCSERNILNGSTRQQLCDSTLSEADKIKSQNLSDQRPNKAKDRDILGV